MVLWSIADLRRWFDPHLHCVSDSTWDPQPQTITTVITNGWYPFIAVSTHTLRLSFSLIIASSLVHPCKSSVGIEPWHCGDAAADDLVVLYKLCTSPTWTTKCGLPALPPTPDPGDIWSFVSSSILFLLPFFDLGDWRSRSRALNFARMSLRWGCNSSCSLVRIMECCAL